MTTSPSAPMMARTLAILTAAIAIALAACSGAPIEQTPTVGASGPAQTEPLTEATASSSEASSDPGPGDAAITSPPLEFTACIPRNAPFFIGTSEQITLPSPDGEVTVEVDRGSTWRGTITATDARLSGTHYTSFYSDAYTLPGGGTQMAWAESHQIENDDGRWYGSSVGFSDSGDDSGTGPAVLIGEGSYGGLTAIIVTSIEGDCFINVRGFVTSLPPTPAPITGE